MDLKPTSMAVKLLDLYSRLSLTATCKLELQIGKDQSPRKSLTKVTIPESQIVNFLAFSRFHQGQASKYSRNLDTIQFDCQSQ
eukprot:scaffold23464_cov126-Cylindrotheca_fusiformis.AAC.13